MREPELRDEQLYNSRAFARARTFHCYTSYADTQELSTQTVHTMKENQQNTMSGSEELQESTCVMNANEAPAAQKPRYIDYKWPEDNTGWFGSVFSLNGRWRRRECLAIYFACTVCIAVVAIFLPSLVLLTIPCLIALYSAVCKRFHDVNVTSKWVILLLTFRVIAMIFRHADPSISLAFGLLCDLPILVLFFWPPSKGINRYGSNPRRDYNEQCMEIGLPNPDSCV